MGWTDTPIFQDGNTEGVPLLESGFHAGPPLPEGEGAPPPPAPLASPTRTQMEELGQGSWGSARNSDLSFPSPVFCQVQSGRFVFVERDASPWVPGWKGEVGSAGRSLPSQNQTESQESHPGRRCDLPAVTRAF